MPHSKQSTIFTHTQYMWWRGAPVSMCHCLRSRKKRARIERAVKGPHLVIQNLNPALRPQPQSFLAFLFPFSSPNSLIRFYCVFAVFSPFYFSIQCKWASLCHFHTYASFYFILIHPLYLRACPTLVGIPNLLKNNLHLYIFDTHISPSPFPPESSSSPLMILPLPQQHN